MMTQIITDKNYVSSSSLSSYNNINNSLHREPIQESRDITNAPISTLTERVDRRGTPPPIKTEAPRQTGPESRVTGRETPVPPASRRWVPPSLVPQYGLTEEAQNDAIFRKVRGILNKLTPENFQKLSDELLKIDLNAIVILKGVIHLLFEKALDEPKYSSMYAQLCKRLSDEAPHFQTEPNKPCKFLNLLLRVCEDRFVNRTSVNHYNHNGDLYNDDEEKKHIAKQKMLGNVKFICELSKLHMLSFGILHKCIQQLLDKTQSHTIKDRCDDMECLRQLIRTCGKDLDTEQGKSLMDQYFSQMARYSSSNVFPPRIRFLLRDLMELRNNGWIPRKVTNVEGPVPMQQLRPDDDDLIRSPYMNHNKYNRNQQSNEFDNDRWMSKMSLNYNNSGSNDFNGLNSVTSISSHFNQPYKSAGNNYNKLGSSYNNQRNNQNHSHNNYNNHNRYNKHNNQHNSHNNYNNSNMLNNKDLAPRFKRNLITPQQESVENLTFRPAANSLLFKATVNIKMSQLPLTQPRPASTTTSSSITNINSSIMPSALSTNNTNNHHLNNHNHHGMIINPLEQLNINNISSQPSPIQAAAQQKMEIKMPAPVNNLLNKDQILIKQASLEKPKQTKKDKGPNKEEVLKRVTTFLADSFTSTTLTVENERNIDDIVAAFHDLKVPDKFMRDAMITILNEIIDKPDTVHERVFELLMCLRKENKLQTNAILDGFKALPISIVDSTIPRCASLIAALLCRGVVTKLCKISDIATYTDGGQHYPLFLLVLQQLHKQIGKQSLIDLYNESKVNLMNTLPDPDRTKDRMAEILDDRNLSFLYPLLKLQGELQKQIQADANPTQLYKWIKDNVDAAAISDPGFITALMTVLLKYITGETTLAEGIDPTKNPDKSITEKERVLLQKYCPVLEAFLHENSDLQLVAIYALQVFCNSVGFPKGMLLRWFTALYDLEVIEEESFLRWKEDLSDAYPGKGNALFQVNSYLTWLETTETDEEEEGDD